MNSDKIPYIIFVDINSLIEKIDESANISENSSTSKIGEHIPCRYSVSPVWAFDHIENKHTLYCGKDCMKKFCKSLRDHAKNVIDFKKKKLLTLLKEELKSYQDAKVCYICGKRVLKNLCKNIN